MTRLNQHHSLSRLIGLRFALTALCCAAAVIWSVVGFAATPAGGTLVPGATLSYTAGPFFVPNVSNNVNDNGQPTCGALNPCDDYALTVAVPAG